MAIPITFTLSTLPEVFCGSTEMAALFDQPINDQRFLHIIAFNRFKRFSSFLNDWAQMPEAEYFVSDIMAGIYDEPSRHKQLAMLLAIFLVHRNLFGAGIATKEIAPHLPNHLSRRGFSIFQEAVSSFAQNFGLEDTLNSLTPLRLGFEGSQEQFQRWKGYWDQSCPKYWNLHLGQDATWELGTLSQSQSPRDTSDTHHPNEALWYWDRGTIKRYLSCCFGQYD
ncbi:uncharacterized protein PV07_04721 [Cladophialophora immunda]|uniref:Uncharacterized protein n=1 Tax=Cladophialophora immunda TaxID=569365 RepID=A0A0D2CCQ1_9EURO|nr:uncharacterized protein PV07_04721 [Cladophialophora immunda]KIW28858.1 hypothetical protein PV07_04721 [Cladophialophora immunda]